MKEYTQGHVSVDWNSPMSHVHENEIKQSWEDLITNWTDSTEWEKRGRKSKWNSTNINLRSPQLTGLPRAPLCHTVPTMFIQIYRRDNSILLSLYFENNSFICFLLLCHDFLLFFFSYFLFPRDHVCSYPSIISGF